MGRKELERLVGKLRSMHLTVPGAVAQHKEENTGPGFHREISNWSVLAQTVVARPTHLITWDSATPLASRAARHNQGTNLGQDS